MHLDDILIGYFLGSTMLGYYTVAYKLFDVLKDLLTSVTTSVVFPTFSRLQDDPKQMQNIFYQVLWYTSLISFPAFIGMALIAPELISKLPARADTLQGDGKNPPVLSQLYNG